MSVVESLAQELESSQSVFHAAVIAAPAAWDVSGATGAWSVAKIVAHAIEFQPFWVRQIRRMLEEPNPIIGRVDEVARKERVTAVERNSELPHAQALVELRHAARAALAQVRALSPDQLTRKGIRVDADGASKEQSVEQLVRSVLIKHLREHTEQIAQVSQSL